MEFFDKVDLNDKVVGKTTKKKAHEMGYPHRVAAIFVFDKNGKLLVQKRKEDGWLDHSVGGHVSAGESYGAAALRELQEELGLRREKLDFVGVLFADERIRSRNKMVHFFGLYETTLNEKDVIKIAEREVESLFPMSLEEIAKGMNKEPIKYTTGFMKTLNFYIEKKNLNISPVEYK
ncbi:MAG: NUDIX hydrolase [Patescibacteria group bacterium]